MNARKVRLVFFLLLALSACDHGLEPPPATKPGFGGRISYVGNWPPADSLVRLALVAFKDYPPTDIVDDVLSGRAVYDTALARNVDFQDYQFFTDPATFKYVVVAQQYGSNLFSDWRVIGVYSDNPSQGTPKSVVVSPETFVSGIDITVDFDHPPPQFFIQPVSP
jgi:hypothetical protein